METQALHFAELKPAISPNVGDSGAQFLVGGDCVRASPAPILAKSNKCIHTHVTTQYSVASIISSRVSIPCPSKSLSFFPLFIFSSLFLTFLSDFDLG